MNAKFQKDIADTLNDNFTSLTVLKNPSSGKLTFLIDGKPYIEQILDAEGKPKVKVYENVKEDSHPIIPVVVAEHHYLNIFNNSVFVKANFDEYYIIKSDVSMGIYIVDKNNHIVPHCNQIFENFNIFEGTHIVVDLDTFRGAGYVKDNGIIDLDLIKKTILQKYHVSNVKKLIAKKDLRKNDLIQFIKDSGCKLNSNLGYDPLGNSIFFIVDNFGDHYEVSVSFDDSIQSSSFSIIRKTHS